MAFPFLKAALRAHGDRRQRRLAASRQMAEGRLVFEALEPRVLLSADALTVALSGDAAHPMAHDVVVEAVSQHLPATDSVTVQMVQVVDLSANNQVLASGALSSISNIQITSGTGNTSLTVDTASFGTAKAPAITFTGGNGNNTLAVTGANETDWAITGSNAGSVTGSAAITFTGVSNLSGGADNTNTFTVTPGGALAGTLSGTPDGSVGGIDTLVFQNDSATNAAFTATGPHSGTVNLDGSVFTYAGLTPIIFSGNATNVTITGSTSTDDLTLADTSVAGQMEVASLNNSLESITFARPTASLTVDFGSGNNDSLEIGTLQLAGADLTVAGGNGSDSVSVDPGAYVSTRDTTGNTLNAPSLGNSGDMNLSAETITVNTGAQLYANANSGFTAGDIVLDASATGGAGQTPTATVAVHGAQIVAGDVTLQSDATATATISQQTTATLQMGAEAQTEIDGHSGILATTGSIDIEAADNVTAQVTASAAPLGALDADAAVALSDVTAGATASVDGTSILDAAGTLHVFSSNTTSVTTLADGTTGGAGALGGTVALADVTTSSTAELGAGVRAGGASVAVEADSATTVSTMANATAGGATANGSAGQGALMQATTPDGGVTVAAAIAGSEVNDTDTAASDARTIASTQGFDVIADASREVVTAANASDVQGGPGVGAAVALNAISVDTTATLGGTSTIYGNADVSTGGLRTGDLFGAVALSGAGDTNVGVAGALAINDVTDDTFGGIAAAAQVKLPTGDLTVVAAQDGDAITDAIAFLNGASAGPGVGASVAIAPVTFDAEAGVQSGATLSVGTASSTTGDDASFTVTAKRLIDTTADGGTAGGTGTAAALAITVGQDTASAELDTGATVTVQGNLTLTATQTSDVHTTGITESGAQSGVFALGIVLDNTDATTAAVVVARDTVSLTATGDTSSITTATGGPQGTQASSPSAAAVIAQELGFLGNPAGVALPTPADADGSFGVAAAMALGVVIGRVSATVLPETAAKEAVTAQGIDLTANGQVIATTKADASADALGVGIGAALALQTGQAIIQAEIESPVSAPDIGLTAGSFTTGTNETLTDAGIFTVQAISGAGGTNVGVAGAMAIAGDGITVQALLDSVATSSATGTVVLVADGTSTSNVDASALGGGANGLPSTGVGASFALDVTDATVTAQIGDGGSVTGGPNLLLGSTGGQNATTTAEGGSAGGTATGAAFSLAVVTDEISAGLTSKATAGVATTFIEATGTTTAVTTTTADAGGQTAAIGAGLALGILVDDASAEMAGRLIALGPVTMSATDGTNQTTTANAGSLGAAANSLDAGTLLSDQLAFLNDPNGIAVPLLETGGGTMGVAAALSFGVDDATAETDVSGRLATEGDLTMTATGGSSAFSNANSKTVDAALNGTGIAAAAAIMVATPKTSARVDGLAFANDATLTATMATPTGHDIQSNAQSGAGDANTGVAGSFALTVAAPVTEADVGGSGILRLLGGNAMLSATGASTIGADARAALLGTGKSGLGASVALDIALDDTHAELEQGANVTGADGLSLDANGTYSSDARAEAGSQSGGAADAVAINVAPQDTEAEVEPGTALTVTGDLSIRATQSQTSVANADGGAGSRGGGFGAALAVNAPVGSTTALLDRGATAGGGVFVSGESTAGSQAQATAGVMGGSDGGTADGLSTLWLGVAGSDGSTTAPIVPNIASALSAEAQNLGLTLPEIDAAAALAVNAGVGTTSASIAGGVQVTAGGAVVVLAEGTNTADSNADASALASQATGTVGFGFAVDFASQSLQASIGAATPVSALSITVEAMVPREDPIQDSAEAMSGVGASDGVAGALALDLVSNDAAASIESTAPIDAPDFIIVEAIGDTDSSVTAGESNNNTVVGTGVALAGNLVLDRTEASVAAGADLNSLGEIAVEAEGNQSLTSESAGIATAGEGDVPASLTADFLLATTSATVGDGARIDVGATGGTASQNLLVLAQDKTLLNANAGSLGVGTLAGVGAAAQFSDLSKQTTAEMDGTVHVAGTMQVQALSAERGLTAADSGALGAGVAVAAGAAVQLGDLLTKAEIGGDARVLAVGDVVVTALDTTQMDVFAGVLNGALAAAAGAGVGAIGLIKTTEALIDANAVVDAEGQGAGTQAMTGLAISFVPDNPGPGEVGTPFLPTALSDIFGVLLNNPLHNLISPVASIPSDEFNSNERVATPDFTTIHGVAVTALSHDDLALQATGLGAAAAASLELSAAGIASNSTTKAEIGAGAKINQSNLPDNADQNVLVFADGDTQAMGIAGTDTLGGLAAVGPAAALLAIDPNTIADIGVGAKVFAEDGVTVAAVGSADLLTDATDVVASTFAGAGSADAIVLGGETYAYVDANAVVVAFGSVSINANEDALTQNVAGALSDGSGAVAAGASAGISLVATDTEAWIGNDAHVSSLGFAGEQVQSIETDPTATQDFTQIAGVSVLATTNDLVMDLVANGSEGGFAAFIGSGAAVVVGNTTIAYIGDGAVVHAGVFGLNGNPVNGDPAKSVSVGAVDNTETWDGIASVVDSDLAISGAADAGVVRDTTNALVDAGATIKASGDVDVAAWSSESVNSFVGGLGLTNGGVELNISASVYSIGALTSADLLDPLSVVGGPGSLESYLDGLIQGMVAKAGQGIVGVLNQYASGVGGSQAAATQLASQTPDNPVTGALDAASTMAGTVANIDDATITAFGNAEVTAVDAMTPSLDTSFTFSHSFGGSSQNLNLSLDAGLLAARANATASVTGGSRVTAANDIDVRTEASSTATVNSTYAFNSSADNSSALVDDSRLTAGNSVTVNAQMDGENKYSGILPGINGLKIRTTYNNEENTTIASVTDGSVIEANGAVTVNALSNSEDHTIADGATLLDQGFEGVFSLGLALSWNQISDTTQATIDHSNALADSVSVTATANTEDFALGFGVGDGDNNTVALAGSGAENIMDDTISATVENATVIAPDGVVVQATDNETLLSVTGAATGRTDYGLGAAISLNTTDDNVTAEIGASTVTTDGEGIQVLATGDANMSTLAAAFAQSKNLAIAAGAPVDNLGMVILADVTKGSDLTTGTGVTVNAVGDGTILTLAGGVAIATSQVGAGGAVAINNDTESVTAAVIASSIVSGGAVQIEALSDPSVYALAFGFAYAPTFGLGGSVSINNINDTTTAEVENTGKTHSSIYAGDGDITVSATDNPYIKVLTGAIAASNGQVAVAGSVSDNYVGDTVNVQVTGANLTAKLGAITVQGDASPSILAIAVAGSGAQNFAGAGAVMLNKVSSTMTVTVGAVAATLSAPTVTVEGDDSSNIGGAAYGVAVAQTVSLAGAFATDTITGGMTVSLDGHGVIDAQDATVSADNSATIEVMTGAADGAGTASVGAAVSINNITDYATSQVVGGHINAADTSVTADQTGTIEALATVGSGAGTVDAVASVTTNNIYDAANATISDGAIIATGNGGSLTLASTNGGDIESLSGTANGAGNVAVNGAVANNNISLQDNTPGGANTLLENSTVSGGSADVTATDSASILSVAIAAGGAATAAVGGSVAKANGNNTATVAVTNDKETLSGAMTMAADDNGSITTAAGNAEGAGTFAGGAAIAINTLTNNVMSTLTGGNANVGSLAVTAMANGSLGAVGAIGGGAGTVAIDVSDTENTITGDVGAAITGAAVVTANGAVTVGATDKSSIESLSGAADGAGTVGGAAARAHNRIGAVSDDSIASDPGDNNPDEPGDATPSPAATTATIDDGATVIGKSVEVTAAFTASIETAAIAGSAAGTAAIAGSLTDNLIGDQVSASISGATTGVFATAIGNGDVSVGASDGATIESLAGSGSGAGVAAVGVSGAANKLRNSAVASIDAADVWSVFGNVAVTANGTGKIESIAFAGSGGGDVALDGAVTLNDIEDQVGAMVDQNALVRAAQNVTLKADDGGMILSNADGAAISGGFGGAGAVATNNIADQVTAEIDDATVRAIDNTVYVLVDDTSNIQSLSLALSGGTAALAATVSVNEIGNTLDATIDAATVEGGNTVSLESSDNSTIKSSADELSAGVVGVGGGAAYNQIENTVDATIEDGSTVTADSGDVLVQAMEQAGITTLAAGGAGGLVGVGGSVSVSIIADNVTASIENSTVTAAGNIGVIGQANDTIDGYGGEIAGGAVGAAGSVTVITLESTVAAQIEGSTVAATGLTPALIVPDIDPTTGAQSTRNGSGVVVAAQDLENATDIAVTAAGGLAGLAGTVADVHTATITDAHITASTVNTAAHPGSGVLVHATQATIVNGTLGAGAVGFVAVGAAVQVITIDNQTRAYIADQRAGNETPGKTTSVYANTINVSTETFEQVSPSTVGISVGVVAVSGSVAYTDIDSSSQAYVQEATLQAKNGAAGITVAAEDNAAISTFAGNFDVGLGAIGAAVGASTIADVTTAALRGATLDANGAILVSASSTGNISDEAIGASGGIVAVAGSILVDHIDSQTEATTKSAGGRATLINQDPGFGGNPNRNGQGSAQSVTIEASGDQTIGGTVGAGAGGLGAAGAGILVGGIDDYVDAEVEGGTVITAAGNVTVKADDQRNASTDVIAAAGGFLALGGAFSVISIGGAFDPQTGQQVNGSDTGSGPSNAQSLLNTANSSVSESPASSGIDTNQGTAAQGTGTAAGVAQNATDELNQQQTPTVGSDLFAAPGTVSGTFATVDSKGAGGAPRITAGGNILVSVDEGFTLDVKSGSGAGGLASVGISVALATVTDTATASVTGSATLSAAGSITIDANEDTSQPATVGAITGQGGVLAVGGAVADATLNLKVTAALGPDVTVQRATIVDVNTTQSAELSANGYDLTVGAVATGVVVSTTIITGNVDATVGSGTVLGSATSPIGSLTIASTGSDVGIDSTTAGAGGVFGGEVNAATVTVNPDFSATLGDNTTSNVAGAVSIIADATGVAQTSATGVAIGAGAVGESDASSTLGIIAAAGIGTDASVTAGGDVTVTSNYTTTAPGSDEPDGTGVAAAADASSGGLITGTGADATATDDGQATSTVGDGTHVQAGGTLAILATVVNVASSSTDTGSFSLVGMGGQTAISDTEGQAIATLGDNTYVQAFALQVEGAANDSSNATSTASAGGIAGTSTGAEADADASPKVVATIGSHALVQVLSTVDILAVAEPYANGVAEGSSVSGFYSGGQSTVDVTGTPDVVAAIADDSTIKAGGGVQVLAETPTLGEVSNGTFNAANGTIVELNNNEIVLPFTLLQTGDQVVYEGDGGTPIGGLQEGRTYSVINDGNGISLGQSFTGAQVNAATGTIQFAAPDGFQTGDRVVYSSGGGTPIGGLVNGQTYYVRVINPTTIKLATTIAQAEQAGTTFSAAAITAGGLITLAGNGFTNGEAVTYRSTGAPIAGLVNGDTYFVQRVNANQFRLSALPNGPALALATGFASSIQTLGAEGVAIDGAGITSPQTLEFKFTSLGTGVQQFAGAGGAAAALPTTQQDGYNGDSQASGGALVGNIGSQTTITINGKDTATVGANTTVQSGTSITITITGDSNSDDTSSGVGSGFVGLGYGTGTTNDTETTTVQLSAGSSLVAGQDVTIFVDGSTQAPAYVESNGGGAVKSATSTLNVNLDPTVGIMVGQNARVTAAGDVNMDAQAEIGMMQNGLLGDDFTTSGGFGLFNSDSNSYTTVDIGAPGGNLLQPATVSVQVGNGATLTGGNVLLEADFDGLDPNVQAYAEASGAHVNPTADANLLAITEALVQVDGGANITATNQVNLLSSYGAGGQFTILAVVNRNAVTASQNPNATDDQSLWSNINVEAGANITAHSFQASVTDGQQTPSVGAYDYGYTGQNQPDQIQQNATENRTIEFNGNLVLTAGPSPSLVVNEFGQIAYEYGLTTSVSGGQIVVSPITDTSPGVANFSSDAGTQWMASGNGVEALQQGSVITGTQGSVTFVDTFALVTLDNGSAMNMVVNGIDPVLRTPGAAVGVQLDDYSQFHFTLLNTFEPTTISIANTAASGVGNLILAGDIEDPIGSISLSAAGGNITASSLLQLITGASVSLNAGGNIGTTAQRLLVDVVDSPQAGISLNANAGGDLNLAVQARLRDPSAFIFLPALGNLIAGGNINLDLLQPVRDNTVTGPEYTTTVYYESPTYGLLSTTKNENAWPTDTGGPQPLPPGIFATGSTPYSATYTIGLLEAGGNITVIDPGSTPIGLTANVDLTSTGSISATMSGAIALTETAGNMRVGTIDSTGGNVTLTAQAGSILGAATGGPGHPASVIGDSIGLTASTGSIGTLNNALNITLQGGKLDAIARNGINIYEVSGSLLLDSVVAGGAVVLGTADGSILAAPGATGPEVAAQTITLNAKGGGIGTAANPLTVKATARNGVTSTATGRQYVDQLPSTVLHEAGLTWTVGDGGTPSGRVDWACLT